MTHTAGDTMTDLHGRKGYNIYIRNLTIDINDSCQISQSRGNIEVQVGLCHKCMHRNSPRRVLIGKVQKQGGWFSHQKLSAKENS